MLTSWYGYIHEKGIAIVDSWLHVASGHQDQRAGLVVFERVDRMAFDWFDRTEWLQARGHARKVPQLDRVIG